MTELVRWQCVAHGRVQGVGYRARVVDTAERLGLVGSVANQPDGTVSIDVQGSTDLVETFIREVSGPRGLSHAHRIERVRQVPTSPTLDRFDVR